MSDSASSYFKDDPTPEKPKHVMLRNAYGGVLTEADLLHLDWDSDDAGKAHTIIRRLAMNTLIPFCKGVGVDVGSQHCPITDTAIRIDHDPRFKHLQTIDARLEQFTNLDYISASHVVEDFEDPIGLIKRWVPSLKIGGHLCLLIPTCTRYPRPGEPGCNPAHRYETYPETFKDWEAKLGDALKIVSFDQCAKLRDEFPSMFDTDCVYQRVR